MRVARHSPSCAVAVLSAANAALLLAASCTTDGLERLGAGRSAGPRDSGALDPRLDDALRADRALEPDSSVPEDPSPPAGPSTPPDHSVQPGGSTTVSSDAGAASTVPDGGAAEPGPELLPDPGFESGHAGWVGFGSSRILDVFQAHSGSRAILSTYRSHTWEGPIYDIRPLVAQSQAYAISAWVRNEVGTHNIMITVEVTCGGETTYTPISTRAVATQWQQLDGSFIVPDCDDLQGLFVYVEGPPANGNILVDDASLRALTLFAAADSTGTAAGNIASAASSNQANPDNNSPASQ